MKAEKVDKVVAFAPIEIKLVIESRSELDEITEYIREWGNPMGNDLFDILQADQRELDE